MTDITEGLDLLGDWLDAKGYTEEAGLCTRAMDEINRLRDKNIEYEQAMMALQLLQRAEADVKLRAENARLIEERYVEGWNDAIANSEAVTDLRADNSRLRKALNPFAVVAEMTIGESEDDRDLFRPARNGPRLIVADFRKARAAIGETE